MAKITGALYEGGVTSVDGNYYTKCIFRGTMIDYAGGHPPSFINCEFDNVQFGFSGSAAQTMAYLAAIYHGFGEFGKDTVERTFQQLRDNVPPGVKEVAVGTGDKNG